jgi:environmental stress-induced protein Ves
VKIYHHSKLAEQQTTPWKNGGGETTQLAIYPRHSSIEKGDFFWRVGRAKIQQTGPFSQFKGYMRGIVQLTGEPVKLGEKKLHLFEPYIFSGDTILPCELNGKEATDLNMMVNRAWGDFKVSVYQIEKGKKLARYADYVCYYIHDGEAKVKVEVEDKQIKKGELIVLQEETQIEAVTDLNLVVIELTESKRL